MSASADDVWVMQNLAYHACLKIVERRARKEKAWSEERACLNASAWEISTLIDWDAVRSVALIKRKRTAHPSITAQQDAI